MEEAADFALSHPPNPISKREVPKTNRPMGLVVDHKIELDEAWFLIPSNFDFFVDYSKFYNEMM